MAKGIAMRSISILFLVLGLVPPTRGVAQDSLPAPLREVRALIVAGKIDDAIHAADQYTRSHPLDPTGFLLLGDAWFKQMPVGRFRAAHAYQTAERLSPQNPAPPYQYAQVGLWLGGDDGERMVASGMERVLAIDPFYKDAWTDWLTLFRNAGARRRLAGLLEPYRAHPVIRARLALLAIEDERYEDANLLLDSALSVDSTNAAWLALRAQSALEAGDTIAGWSLYRRALSHADLDSTDALWRQAIGIAWPYEVKLWEAGVRPDRKRSWLESFWARRNPNLFAGVNHRIAEHFARLRYARAHFALLHPLISYHRNQISRAINLEPSSGERQYFQRCEMYEVLPPAHLHMPPAEERRACGVDEDCLARASGVPLPGVSSASDRARGNVSSWGMVTDEELASAPPGVQSLVPPGVRQSLFAPLNLDLRSMDSVAARIGYNLATGLDDRGVLFLRFGPPDRMFVGGKNDSDPQCSVHDVERWQSTAYGEVRFSRPSAFSKGERTVPDMVFRAMNEGQFAAARTGLTQDASSEPALLEFGIWTAQFRDAADSGATDLVVISTRGAVAASLESTSRPGSAFTSDAGAVTVPSDPGRYVLVAQAQGLGLLGRQTLAVTVRPYARTPGVSDLLLAPAWDEPRADRAAMLAHLQRTLTFAQGEAVRSYAEIYGLRADARTVRYRAQYDLLRTDRPERDIVLDAWPRATRIEFQRERPVAGAGVEVETLDIVPAQLPPGKYLLRVRVSDLVTGRDIGHGTIAFAVR